MTETQVRVTRVMGDGRRHVWTGMASKITDGCVVLEGGYIHLGTHIAPDPRFSMTTTIEVL